MIAETPYARVAEARMGLILALIIVDADPRKVAEEARALLYDFTDAPTEMGYRSLYQQARRLDRQWTLFTNAHSGYFEPNLLHAMDFFQRAISDATKAVQARALEALSDPANWPFDPDLSPEHETNVEAAKAHKVTYKPDLRHYVDEDGCPRFDRFGQAL
jgi:hypothetical protein